MSTRLSGIELDKSNSVSSNNKRRLLNLLEHAKIISPIFRLHIYIARHPKWALKGKRFYQNRLPAASRSGASSYSYAVEANLKIKIII